MGYAQGGVQEEDGKPHPDLLHRAACMAEEAFVRGWPYRSILHGDLSCEDYPMGTLLPCGRACADVAVGIPQADGTMVDHSCGGGSLLRGGAQHQGASHPGADEPDGSSGDILTLPSDEKILGERGMDSTRTCTFRKKHVAHLPLPLFHDPAILHASAAPQLPVDIREAMDRDPRASARRACDSIGVSRDRPSAQEACAAGP